MGVVRTATRDTESSVARCAPPTPLAFGGLSMGSKLLGSSAVAAAGGGLVGGRGGVHKAVGGVGTLPANGHKDIFQVRGLRTPMRAVA